jgi:hypothetical protein
MWQPKAAAALTMLNIAEARRLVSRHLATTPRATHSCFVAYVMRELAVALAADADLWEIVGLCHDLDFFATSDDRSQHGILTVRWLRDLIPPEARDAIAAHDHRTGVHADTPLADALKIADAIAVLDARLGRRTLREVHRGDPVAELRRLLPDRPYLCDMLEKYAARRGLSITHVVEIAAASPVPSR